MGSHTWVLGVGCRGDLEAGEAGLGSGLCPCCLGKLAVPSLVTQCSHLNDDMVTPVLRECPKEHMKQWSIGD